MLMVGELMHLKETLRPGEQSLMPRPLNRPPELPDHPDEFNGEWITCSKCSKSCVE